MEIGSVPSLRTPRCVLDQECAGPRVAALMSLRSKYLNNGFSSTDGGFQFARRAACRVSLGPLDHPDSEAEVSDNEGEDGLLSPLLPLARWEPSNSCSRQVSESPPPVPNDESEDFAHHVLLSCRKVARHARDVGPNLYDSDSSASPVKRKAGSSSSSPTKRRPEVKHLWEPVFSRRGRKNAKSLGLVREFSGFGELDSTESLKEVEGVDGTEGL